MPTPSLLSLFDLCSVRITYLMWTRHDIIKECSTAVLTDELVEIVSSDVQSLPLPEKVKSHVLKYVKPTGKHLLVLLTLWLSKTLPKNSPIYLTGDMLYESLVLNAYGLINCRKTADKLLNSREFPCLITFRLASINFLEEKIVKSWPIVMEYILNKIVVESEQPHTFVEELNLNQPSEIPSIPYNFSSEFSRFGTVERTDGLPVFLFITEPSEVLYWIGYCMSKQNAILLNELPHFLGVNGDWYENALESTTFSGNIAPCDYFKGILGTEMKCKHAKMIERIFMSKNESIHQQCFIFHFMQLNSEEKAKLFQEFPREMVSQFLQWPMSLTFVENLEEIWNLIPDDEKDWVFIKIFAILYQKSNMLLYTRLTITHYLGFMKRSPGAITGIYNVDHLVSIWVALWKISLNIYKFPILDLFVFSSLVLCNKNPYGFLVTFETSDLKTKLLEFFNSNGELILELYEGKNFKESLRNLLSKYMPEEFEDLDQRLISPITPKARGHFVRLKTMLELKQSETKINRSALVHENFVNCIKSVLFSSNRLDQSICK